MSSTTPEPVTYEVNPKEQTYFAIKVFVSIIMYYLLYVFISRFMTGENPVQKSLQKIFLIYGIIIILFLVFQLVFLVGYLKGNAVKVTQKQFPDIYNIVAKQTLQLGMTTMPDVYIMQSGGVLNAFATNFAGTSYVVIFSDILAAAYDQDIKVVEFVIGHEMGHIKRKHILKRLLLLPGALIPFLGPAYSRACEYTCDRIGYALCPEGATKGMILLAAGRGLSKKVNVSAYMEQIETEDGFTKWIAEKVASHPNLTKRVRAFTMLAPMPPAPAATPVPVVAEAVVKPDDHSSYLPKI
jgi:Zn-dependent protease with chaperone function